MYELGMPEGLTIKAEKEDRIGWNNIMMNKIEEAIIYATIMHQGKVRKLGSIPYILHPLEVAQINKLANIRSVAGNYSEHGDKVWESFHQHDPEMHHWYYQTIAEQLELSLNKTGAFKEFIKHINFIWPGSFDSEKARYEKAGLKMYIRPAGEQGPEDRINSSIKSEESV